MNKDNFYFRSLKGLVEIRLSESNANKWDLFLKGKLICSDFPSAEEAAFCARRNDFENLAQKRAFGNAYVPENIDDWEPGDPPTPSSAESSEDTASDCRSRFRGAGGSPRFKV